MQAVLENMFCTVNGKRRSLAWLFDNATAATVVRIENNPALTALPDLPAATDVRIENNPALTALPDLPAATDVRILNNAALTALPDLPAATVVWIESNAALTALPDLHAATDVRIENNAALTALSSGKDSRGYIFSGVRICGCWRIVAGCRNFTIPEARIHWGAGGRSDRPDCLALVERIAAAIEAKERGE